MKMQYSFKAAMLGAAAVATMLAMPVSAQETNWISGGVNPPGSNSALAAKHFADLVAERSEGRFKITHYPASALGNGQEQMEGLASGTQQLFISSGGQANRLVPEFSIGYAAFLFEDTDHLERFIESDMGKEMEQKLASEFGIALLAQNWYGLPRYLMHNSKFIESTDDVVGVRTRAPGVPMFVANYENIGAIPVQVAYGEQYLALRQGVVDMTESAAHDIYGVKLHEVAPFITEADMMFTQNSVFASSAAVEALSDEDRALVIQAAHDAGDFYRDLMRDAWEGEKAKIIEEGGQFKAMSPQVRAEFAEIISNAVPKMEADGLIPEGWYQRILDLRDN